MPVFDWLAGVLERADALIVNGEGDAILQPRASLWRMLVLMEAAQLVGCPEVYVVNSILSPGEGGDIDKQVQSAVEEVFAASTKVIYRDPESLRLSQAILPGVNAAYRPDALFTWAYQVDSVLQGRDGPSSFEGVPPSTRSILREGGYIAVSGSSVRMDAAERDASVPRLLALLRALECSGRRVVVVATCDGDNWMLPVAARAGVGFIPARAPLSTGIRVLGRAALFLSGRYHPSIMAACCGTPAIFMRSNSHKTASLSEMINGDGTEYPFVNSLTDLGPLLDHVSNVLAGGDEERIRVRGAAERLADEARAITEELAGGRVNSAT